MSWNTPQKTWESSQRLTYSDMSRIEHNTESCMLSLCGQIKSSGSMSPHTYQRVARMYLPVGAYKDIVLHSLNGGLQDSYAFEALQFYAHVSGGSTYTTSNAWSPLVGGNETLYTAGATPASVPFDIGFYADSYYSQVLTEGDFVCAQYHVEVMT